MYPEPSITMSKPFEDYTNPSKIAFSLLEGFYNAGYNLALDNLYKSLELLQVLFENKTDAYETLWEKRACRQMFGHGSQQKELPSLQK